MAPPPAPAATWGGLACRDQFRASRWRERLNSAPVGQGPEDSPHAPLPGTRNPAEPSATGTADDTALPLTPAGAARRHT